jgi:2-dehydropantoate 2-reductase
LPGAPGATFLLFTANWDGTEEIDRLLPRSSILWGYSAASGGPDAQRILIATVNPTVRFGMLEGSDAEKFKAVTELFQRAGFTLDIKPNIIEWLWVHHAINAGTIGIALWAGGIAEATRSFKTLRLGALAIREALDVVAARGVDLGRYPDARRILNTPAWLAGLGYFCAIRFTEKGRRLLGASHFAYSPEEMKRYYFDVLNTGESLGVAMPHLSALREKVERYPVNQSGR